MNLLLPLRTVKVSSTDKPWISAGLKLLIAKRQKPLAIHGKSSQVYRALRNRVQRECSMCKKRFYNNKVSNLQQSNSAGLTYSGDWTSHLINGEITDDASLAQTFNDFLGGLTSHFKPLQPVPVMLSPVPQHLYVSDYKVYKTRCALKTKKSPGPDGIHIVVWKEFAFELSPALADIYNSSLEQG